MIDRNKFAAAAESRVQTVKYKECDCQAFVEACAKDAGQYFNARGTNDMWRNYMTAKGDTASFPLEAGDVVFKWREESDKLPQRYKGDGCGDFYHIGIVSSVSPTIRICHSANSKENGKIDKFGSQEELAKVWQYAGTLNNTASSSSSLDDAVKLIEQALGILKQS